MLNYSFHYTKLILGVTFLRLFYTMIIYLPDEDCVFLWTINHRTSFDYFSRSLLHVKDQIGLGLKIIIQINDILAYI